MNTILEMRGIRKTFPGVVALDNVNLRVRSGEIHAIVGENGAGKSTLMKVLSGVYTHGEYSGDIEYQGEVRKFRDITDSEHIGIIIIHQELALVPLLSIAENIFLGNEPSRLGVIDWELAQTKTRALLKKVGLNEKPDTLITNLGVGKQQLIEIAKALSKDVKLLILDEPTASLNESDSAALLDLLLELKQQGIASILISHKLNEISRVADAITVLRDGNTVDSFDCRAEAVSEDRIIEKMVGREMADRYPPRTPHIGDTIFEVQDWRVFHPEHADRAVIKGINFHAKKGEIIGIAGLMGAGRTELAMSIFGRSYGQKISGRVLKNGQEIDFNTQLKIRCSSVLQKVVNLSGGNQQKVVLAKWLFSRPDILILDEPSRGIDVGAKYEIYSIISELAAKGKCIIMISSEMPELLGMCDRIYVMNEGSFVAEFSSEVASQENIMRAIVKHGDKNGK